MRSPSPPPNLVEYNKLLHAIAWGLYPDPSDPPGLPGVVGKRVIKLTTKIWSNTTVLTSEDQECLRELVSKHAGALPPLRTLMNRRERLTFRRAFRKVENRPEWEPVLRTELDIEQIRSSRREARLRHDAALKIEIAQGRIRHFDSDRMLVAPHFELITYLPWEDAQAYLALRKLDLELLMRGHAEALTSNALPHNAPMLASTDADDARRAEKRKYRDWSSADRDRLTDLVKSGQAEVAATVFEITEVYAKQQAARFEREATAERLRASSRASSSPHTVNSARDSNLSGSSDVYLGLDNGSQARGTGSPPQFLGKTVLRMWEVEELIRMSRSTIYEFLNPNSKYFDSTFPKKISLSGQPDPIRTKKGSSGGAVGFYASEIHDWLAKRQRR